jgi:hypothetical protein
VQDQPRLRAEAATKSFRRPELSPGCYISEGDIGNANFSLPVSLYLRASSPSIVAIHTRVHTLLPEFNTGSYGGLPGVL